jgi:hypothetical protein
MLGYVNGRVHTWPITKRDEQKVKSAAEESSGTVIVHASATKQRTDLSPQE